jgi:serine/threonine protein kinase
MTRYELTEPLGKGAMGVVWLGRDKGRGIDVAVKILHDREDHAARCRLLEEARLCARMSSPNVVKVLDVGDDYIVYERLEGETLAARLDREGKLPLDVAKDIIVQIARALTRCHALGIVHRDVKPENVFLVPQPRGRVLVKLLDFGVAHDTQRGEQELAGTPEYMAPEVIVSFRPADRRADVFALAVVAYECLTGHRPFAAESIEAIRALLGRHAAPVSDFRGDVDHEFDVWMERAMHRDPSRRFQTARALADGLIALQPTTRFLPAVLAA